jgi:hypothetical protein
LAQLGLYRCDGDVTRHERAGGPPRHRGGKRRADRRDTEGGAGAPPSANGYGRPHFRRASGSFLDRSRFLTVSLAARIAQGHLGELGRYAMRAISRTRAACSRATSTRHDPPPCISCPRNLAELLHTEYGDPRPEPRGRPNRQRARDHTRNALGEQTGNALGTYPQCAPDHARNALGEQTGNALATTPAMRPGSSAPNPQCARHPTRDALGSEPARK